MTNQAVIDGVQRELHHPNGGGAFAHDFPRPRDRRALQVFVGNNLVHSPHLQCALGVIFFAEEKHFAGKLLPHLPREVSTTKTAIEGTHVNIGLFEPGVLSTGNTQITHHVQAVAATSGPAWDGGNDDLGHKTNQSLDFQNVQPTGSTRINPRGVIGIGVSVAICSTNSLVTTGAKRPTAIFGAWAVPGQNHYTECCLQPGVIQSLVKLIDCSWSKRVSDLGSVEGNTSNRPVFALVVGDIFMVLKA